MALTPTQQSSRLFKKSLGAAETLVAKEFFSEPKLGKTTILPSQIWTNADRIPTTAPTLTNGQTLGVVKYFEKLSLTHIAGSNNLSYFHESLKNTIPFNYGDGSYNYALYKSDGTTQIPFGQPGGDWLIDTEAGVITWYGTLPAGVTVSTPPQVSFYKYVGEFGIPTGKVASSGLIPKPSVRCATTANITNYYELDISGFTTLPAEIDSVTTFNDNDRILIKDQILAYQNGIYIVSANTLLRADDTDGIPFGEVSINDYVFILSGTTNVGNGWVLSSSDSTDIDKKIVVGVNTQNWTLFETSKLYYADNNALKLNGNTFSILLNSAGTYASGLYQSVDGLRLSDTVINDLQNAINSGNSLYIALSAETVARISGDTYLQSLIDANTYNIDNGLTLSANTVEFGGVLSKDTILSGNYSYGLDFNQLSHLSLLHSSNSGLIISGNTDVLLTQISGSKLQLSNDNTVELSNNTGGLYLNTNTELSSISNSVNIYANTINISSKINNNATINIGKFQVINSANTTYSDNLNIYTNVNYNAFTDSYTIEGSNDTSNIVLNANGGILFESNVKGLRLKSNDMLLDWGDTTTGVATITGNSAFAGIQYYDNYATNFTNRSLVDKEYVDTTITSSGVTATSAGSGLTYNTNERTLNINVDNYTLKLVNDELRGSQIWIQNDKTTTILAGTTGITNITLTYDPITPVQVYINGIIYLVNVGATTSAIDKPFYFNTLIPTIGSKLYYDANIGGFGLESDVDLITCNYQYVDVI